MATYETTNAPPTLREPTSLAPRERSSIPAGAAWMVLISIALFFVPPINGLVAGLFGGWKVGTIKRGLIAAIVPAIVAALAVWAVIAIFEAPLIGFLAGATVGILVLFADVGLFIGAAIGGWLASRPRT